MAQMGDEWSSELRKGSIQLCMLALLRHAPKYGFQILKELSNLTKGYLELKEGTLYPALHRLEKRGLLKSEWVIEGDSAPRKYYSITPKGRAALDEGLDEWKWMVDGCEALLEAEK
ncbi:MAG: PadR family transcriptional regulator [Euryarchaeota archaeon]|nr:PadR family transcriptional regulator [Euryarchaeota archaeon]